MPYNHDPEPDPPKMPGPHAAEEPVYARGTVVAVGAALLAVATALGLKVDEAQQTQILIAIAALAPVILAVWARAKAWSPASVRRLVEQERRKAVEKYIADQKTRGGFV